MDLSPTLDFDSLIAPINESTPTGESAKNSSLYSELRHKRQLAQSIERKSIEYEGLPLDQLEDLRGNSDDPRKPPDWSAVDVLAQDILKHFSKDVQVVVWLVEAHARLSGLVGLRDGFKLCYDLVDRYWDTLHPQPENGEDDRRDYFDWWNKTLPVAIERFPITDVDPDLSFHTARIAKQIDKLDPDKRTERLENGAIEQNRFDRWVRDEYGIQEALKTKNEKLLRSAADTIQEEIQSVRAAFEETVKGIKDLESLLNSKFSDPVTFVDVSETVARTQAWYLELSDAKLDSIRNAESVLGISSGLSVASSGTTVVEGVPVDDGQVTPVKFQSGGAWSVNQAIQSREEAFSSLLRVADYFQVTEPHSPVSYALKQAVRWGRMTLPELLQDLVGDDALRRDLFRTVGIQEPKESDSD
jgi:type VI secretion system protein ImpA